MSGSSASRMEAAFSGLETWAPMAPASPSANCSSTLPVRPCRRNTCCMYLDAGTNNEQYLHDPHYLGMRKTRPSTAELFSFVDEFVEAVQEVFPKCCIHFEDWTGVDAVHLLQRYRDKYCVYNDD